MLTQRAFGEAGARVVIEDFLQGEEASFIVMSDGTHALPLATSQDHKRLRDGDQGPNTGGMGAYSPAPIVTPKIHARVMREIIQPAIQGMAQEGMPYTGFLYAGLMIDATGNPKTLEFNCRLGDPETQPILLRLKSDLLDLIERALAGALADVEVDWDRRAALGVVLAAHGYPDEPRKGDAITGLPPAADDCRCSMPAPGSRARISSPTAAACSASPRSATRCAWPARAPTRSWSVSASTACNTAGTSASAA
jgi:phosphoribosylamine---glycine ligase